MSVANESENFLAGEYNACKGVTMEGNGKKKADIESVLAKLKSLGCVYIVGSSEEGFSGGAAPSAIIDLAVDAIEQMVQQHGDMMQASKMSAIAYDLRKLAQDIRDKK